MRGACAALLVALGVALGGGASAQETLRPEVGKPLQAAQELIKSGRYKEALAKVREAEAARRAQRQRDLHDRADADRRGVGRWRCRHRGALVRGAERLGPGLGSGQAAHDRVDRQHLLPLAAVREVDAVEPALCEERAAPARRCGRC